MKIKFKYQEIYKYLILIWALLLTFWILSTFEVYNIAANRVGFENGLSYLGFKLINDFWTVVILGFLFLPLYALFLLFKNNFGNIIFKFLFIVIIVGQFALVKYSLTTLLNLGADLLGYSWNDMYTTVTATESFSFLYFLPYFIFPVIFLSLSLLIEKKIEPIQSYAVMVIFLIVFGGLKLVFSQTSEQEYQNKLNFLVSDIIRFQQNKNEINAYKFKYRNSYPTLKPFSETSDVLAPFFDIGEEKPNVVIIIMEGLGSEFIGKNSYRGFTPYLDKLIDKSLFFENFVSNTGRTFGVLPSILGSLPLGEKGFLELNPLPSHFSLVSVLRENNYTTSFYCGDDSSFDRKINFLEYNNIDYVIDQNKFGPEYEKTQENSGGFSWGYPDEEIFKKVLAEIENKKQPRLDIIMTLTNHEPFDFPAKQEYLQKVDSILKSSQLFNVDKEEILSYKDIFSSILYSDNALKNFMAAYAKRPDYKNTIFIITGDHRLIPINQKDKLCRFHVPLFIYSPMLKRPQTFKSVSSHSDVTPSLLSFLMNNYQFNKLQEVSWMSKGLDTAVNFRNIHQIPLMRYKGSINDFIYKDYLYSDGNLYKINENFGTYKVNEEALLNEISDSLLSFKRLNAYLVRENKIFPDSLNIYTQPAILFSKEENEIIKKLTKGLNFDEIFFVARDLAFKKDYKTARLLCDYILNNLPNYADVRTLKGRIYAWQGVYEKAEIEFLNVIKRTPFYFDSYLAIEDLYWWSNQDDKSIAVYKLAMQNNIENPDVSFKLAEAYQRMNNRESAHRIIDSLLGIYPENKKYLTFKNTLK